MHDPPAYETPAGRIPVQGRSWSAVRVEPKARPAAWP